MAASRVYVGGIPHDCRTRDLDKFFKGYGRIRDILIKNGYGFVEFDSYRDADDAVYDLNGRDLMGMRVTVEHARGMPRSRGGYPERSRDRRPPWSDRGGRNNRYGPPTRTPFRCYVENLSSKISWQDLKDYMRKAGTITFADAHRHKVNEGIVEFASYTDLKRAIERLDDTELSGRRIRLINDYRRGSRSRSRSRRSRSRSRSRSRRSRSRSRSRRSRSGQKSRSRSRSNSRGRFRSGSRSKSRSKSRSRSHRSGSKQSRSRSRSPKRESRSKSPARDSRSRSRKRSGSRSPVKDTNATNGKRSRSKSRSRSRSASYSPAKRRRARSKSRSRSKSASRSRSRSRSRTYSPNRSKETNGNQSEED